MNRKSFRVLGVGLGAAHGNALAQAVRTAGHSLERSATGEAAARLAADTRFQLVVVGHPLPDSLLGRVVRSVRSARSASREAALMVIAEPGYLDEATSLVGRGVNRAFATTEHTEILVGAAFRLLEAGSPESQRFGERLEVALLLDGRWCPSHTEDVSASGMLIASDAEAQVGVRIQFRLRVPGVAAAIEGEAKIMRRVELPGTGRRTLGVRFCTFEGSGRQLLARHLEALRAARPV